MVFTGTLGELAEQNVLEELGDNPLRSQDPLYALPAKIIARLRHGRLISRTAATHGRNLADLPFRTGSVPVGI
ncbi:MAG: hypothetical protein ACYSUI_16600 [Planctomycetota bacterium]|jgi:hypothetical protein